MEMLEYVLKLFSISLSEIIIKYRDIFLNKIFDCHNYQLKMLSIKLNTEFKIHVRLEPFNKRLNPFKNV